MNTYLTSSEYIKRRASAHRKQGSKEMENYLDKRIDCPRNRALLIEPERGIDIETDGG